MKRILCFVALLNLIFTFAFITFGGDFSSEQDLPGKNIILAQNTMIPGAFTKAQTPDHNLKGKATPWVYGDSTSGAQIYYNSDYATKDIDIFKFDGEYGDIIRCSFQLPPDEHTFDGAINLVNVDSISYKIEDDSAGGCDEVLDYRLWESGIYYLVLGKWNELKEGPYKKNVYEGDDKAFYTMKLEHFPSPEISVTPDSINLGYISSREMVTDQLEITNTGPAGATDLEFNIDFGYIIPLLSESFGVFPPDGWTLEGGMNWQGSNSNHAGGTPPEAEFYWSPATVATQRLISPIINAKGDDSVCLEFLHYVDHYEGSYTLGIATTSDGGTTWNDVWTVSPTDDVGLEGRRLYIDNSDVSSGNFQFCFYLAGDSFAINWWNIDNVCLYIGNGWASAEPYAGFIPQGETMTVDINADPMGLEDGFHEATINLHNNALPGGASDLQIPLNFYIGEESGGLEGNVTSVHTGDPVENVKVTAGNFVTYTDTDGFYNLDPIALGVYDVLFEKDGFQTAGVYGVPLSPTYTVILDQELQFAGPPPRNFAAECGCGCCHLSWEEPDLGGWSGVTFILDDGSSENGWAINPGNEAWLGNQFPVADAGELISFDVYGEQTMGASAETVAIDVFDVDHNLVGTTVPFQIPAGSWTTVSAPNIPFDGEFYAMVHWDELLPETNCLGFDENGPNANANYDWYYDGSTWQVMHESLATNPGVCMLRATAVIDSNCVNLSPDPQKIRKETTISNKTGINYESVEESKKTNLGYNRNNRAYKDLTILGYNIYEEEKGFVAFVGSEIRDFTDEFVQIGHEYTYWVNAVYNLGEGLPSNTDSCIPYFYSPGGLWENFHEDWATTGKWFLDPASPNNWEYYASGQCARLSWSPSTPNYDMSLVSEEFTLPADTSLIFDFTVNMYINDYSVDTGEKMEIWLVHDSVETMIFQWDLDENDDWGVSGGQDWVYTDTDQFAGETVKIKFRSHGGDTYNINYWYVYSVRFEFYVLPDYGILEGVVTDSDGLPIEGAMVKADDPTYNPVYTNQDGEYEFNPMLAGTYDVTFSASGYTTIVEEDVVIEADQTTVLDVVLGQPTMEIEPTTINDTLLVGEVDSSYITITNNGDGTLNWIATIEENRDFSNYHVNYDLKGAPGKDSNERAPTTSKLTPTSIEQKDTWDILYNFNDVDAGNPGIETNGEYIYTSDWRADEMTFHEFDMQGNFIQQFNITGASQIRDMAYDGEYFYGAAANMSLKKMDLPIQQLVETIYVFCSGITGVRHIAYDPELDACNGGFWIGNWDELGAIDMDGNQIYANINPSVDGLYGSAYDHVTPGGPYLWLFSHEPYPGAVLHQFDIASQSFTGVTHNASDIPGYLSGSVAGGAATYTTQDGLFALLVNIQQDPNLIGCYELGDTQLPWMALPYTSGTVPPYGGTYDFKVTLNAGGDPPGTFHSADIVFTSPQGVPSVTTEVTLLVVLPSWGTLEGTVTDTDMNPLPNATVTAGNHEAVTDSNGFYLIEYLATGSYEVIASHANYNTSDPVTSEILENQTTLQDFSLTQPTMEVTPTTIQEYVAPNDSISVDLTVANNGDGPLNYYINLIRGLQTDYSNCTSGIPAVKNSQSSGNNSSGFVAEKSPGGEAVIHYDGPHEDGFGLTNGGTFMAAARFTSDELNDYYENYQLFEVELYICDMPASVILKVWEGGCMGDPGTEIYSENITGQISQESWTTINLNTPIELIADNEYWVGYEVTHITGQYPAGCDAGPAVGEKGDWIYLDPGPWDELQNYGFDYNWNIRADLSSSIVPWITFSPDSGFVEAGSSDIVTVDFNTSSYSQGDILTAQLLFSSEPDVGSQNIDVEITVGEYTIADTIEISHTEISKIFPNPTPDAANIKYTIKRPAQVKLSVFNIKGQLVEILVDEHYDRGIYELEWNPKNISTGIYFLQLKTEEKTYLKKMIIMK